MADDREICDGKDICESRYWRRARISLTLLALAVVVSSCQPSPQDTLPLPASPPVIDVTIRDDRIEYGPLIAAGRVVFRVYNGGSTKHQLKMLPLDEDFPPIQIQLRGSERRVVSPFAGVPAIDPGSRSVFAVDVVPDTRYALFCLLPGRDGVPYGAKGVSTEFRSAESLAAGDESGKSTVKEVGAGGARATREEMGPGSVGGTRSSTS